MTTLMSRLPDRRRHAFSMLAIAAIMTLAGIDAHGDELSALRARVETLEELVAQLQNTLAARDSVSAVQLHERPRTSDRDEGFVIRQSDRASVRLRGLLHFDGRHYANESATGVADGWVLRRARPILQASLSDTVDVGFTPEFAGASATILDAFMTFRAGSSLRLTAGKFKVPVGLERIMAATDLRFIERALPSSLVPNRDLGVQLDGEVANAFMSYSIGYFNGATDGGSSESNNPTRDAGDWTGRLFVHPFLGLDDPLWRGLGVGVAATYAPSIGSAMSPALPAYRTAGQQIFFAYRNDVFADGERLRLAAHLYYHYGRFGVLGEAVESSQRVRRSAQTGGIGLQDVSNFAWQLQLAWLVTGEQQKLRGAVEPNSVLSLDARNWGAFEVVARYHELDIDDATFVGGSASLADAASAASKASAVGVGVNWYLNEYLKWSLNYECTRFDGGAPNGADRPDERLLSGRFAVSF
jgi:phosphate-selective porin OprO/OprP